MNNEILRVALLLATDAYLTAHTGCKQSSDVVLRMEIEFIDRAARCAVDVRRKHLDRPDGPG